MATLSAMPLPTATRHTAREKPRILVHLASFRDRQEAEAFASTVPVTPPQVIYLQEHGPVGATWHRVLLGDFADAQEAAAQAQVGRETGIYSYAQPVQVSGVELEAWRIP